jgi:hypothetical protein
MTTCLRPRAKRDPEQSGGGRGPDSGPPAGARNSQLPAGQTTAFSCGAYIILHGGPDPDHWQP